MFLAKDYVWHILSDIVWSKPYLKLNFNNLHAIHIWYFCYFKCYKISCFYFPTKCKPFKISNAMEKHKLYLSLSRGCGFKSQFKQKNYLSFSKTLNFLPSESYIILGLFCDPAAEFEINSKSFQNGLKNNYSTDQFLIHFVLMNIKFSKIFDPIML